MILVSLAGITLLPEGPVQTALSAGGPITSDTTWSGDIDIDSTVTVNNGVTLTIDGGANVTFKGFFLLIIEGTLKANGTKANPITMKSSLTPGNKGDWAHMLFRNNGHGWLQNATIKNAYKAVQVGLGTGAAVTDVVLKNLTVSSMTLEGVQLLKTSDCIVKDCSFTNCDKGGIKVEQSSYCLVEGNTVFNLMEQGIFLNRSNNCSVWSNTVYNPAKNGIYMLYCNDLLCGGNVVNVTSQNGIFAEGLLNSYVSYNWVSNTSLDGIRAYYSDYNEFSYNFAYQTGMNGIGLWQGSDDNDVVQNVALSCSRRGVRLFDSHRNWIYGNDVSYCGLTTLYDGAIFLESSDRNTIENNTVHDNFCAGIHVMEYPSNPPTADNTIVDNTVYNHNLEGIKVNNTQYTGIYGNILSNNTCDVRAVSSPDAWISYNWIFSSKGPGIEIYNSTGAVLIENTVQDVVRDGISLDTSDYAYIGNNTLSSIGQSGVLVYHSAYPTLWNNTVEWCIIGIGFLYQSEIADVWNNAISNCSRGIYVGGTVADIEGNTIKNNDKSGITLQGTVNCYIFDNYLAYNDVGVEVNSSTETKLWENRIVGSTTVGLDVDAWSSVTMSVNDSIEGMQVADIRIKGASDVTTHNSTFDHDFCVLDSQSQLTCYYYLAVNAKNQSGGAVVCNMTVAGNGSFARSFAQRSSFAWLELLGYHRTGNSFDYSEEQYLITCKDNGGSGSASANLSRSSKTLDITLVYPPKDLGLPSALEFDEDAWYADTFLKYVSGAQPMSLAITGGKNISAAVSGNNYAVNLTTAVPNWNGWEVLTFTFTDALGVKLDKDINVTVTPENDAPYFDPAIPDVMAPEGIGKVYLNLSSFGKDVDLGFEGDALSWYVGAPSSVFTVTGNNLTDNITLAIKDEDYFGVTAVTVHIRDSHDAEATQTVIVNITGVNDPPHIMDMPDKETDAEGLLTLNLTSGLYDVDDPLSSLVLECTSPYATVTGFIIEFNYSASDLTKEDNVTITVRDPHPVPNSGSTTFNITIHLPSDDDVDDDVDDDITNLTDTDHDGLLDSWEMDKFGNLTFDAGDDPDQDGLNNSQEYAQNKDPNVPDNPAPDDDTDDDDDSGLLSTTNLLLLILIILLLVIIAIVVAVVVMRRKKAEPAKEAKAEGTLDAEVETADVFDQKKIAKAMGKTGVARPMEAKAAEPTAPAPAPPVSAPVPEAGLEGDTAEPISTPETAALEGGGMAGTTAGSQPLLALPPAKIFEAEFDVGSRIDELFLMTKDGILIKHFSYKETSIVDKDILASMLTVVQNFVSDSFNKKKAALKKLEFGEFNILIIPGKFVSVVAISPDKSIDKKEKAINLMIKDIEEANHDSLEKWDGTTDSLLGLEDCITKLVNDGYD